MSTEKKTSGELTYDYQVVFWITSESTPGNLYKPMNTIVRYIYHKPELNHLYIYISQLNAILGDPSCSFPNQCRDKWLLAVGYTLINSLLVAPHNINGHFRNQLIGGTSPFFYSLPCQVLKSGISPQNMALYSNSTNSSFILGSWNVHWINPDL